MAPRKSILARMKAMAVAVCMALCTAALAGERSEAVALHIEPQAIRSALEAFASQTGLQVVMREEDVGIEGLRAPRIEGTYTPQAALAILLADSGLREEWINERTVAIRPVQSTASKPSAARQGNEASGLRLSRSSSSESSAHSADDAGQRTENAGKAQLGKPDGPDEIVVTAQKRLERLQDVPIPVSALNAAKLTENNQARLEDYYSLIPGLSLSPVGSAGNEQTLAIRGISAGAFASPTVGITVDDVPYGSAADAFGNVQPDIDPGDLARIEVLRGPQGTLYGASSMGGLLKYVTVDPSTEALSGRFDVGTSTVNNGSALGYSFRGAVNVPLTETFAFRASAFTRQDPGYIDNSTLGIEGVNEARVSGGRLSAFWRPSDAVSVKLSALYQDTRGDGLNNVDVPTVGFPQTAALRELDQSYIRNVGRNSKTVQAYSMIVNARLGAAEVTSVSGYNINEFFTEADNTWLLSGFAQSLLNLPVAPGVPLYTDGRIEKFTQEIRANFSLGSRVDWLVGAFYTREHSLYVQDMPAVDASNAARVADFYLGANPSRFTEYAAFTDVTFHVTNRVSVQIGGRGSRIEQKAGPTFLGGPLNGGTILYPVEDAGANAFTYLFTPQFKISSNMLAYARLASGYRPGGSNAANPDPLIPRASDPDRTQNTEIGIKGETKDRVWAFDASLYSIDWQKIQIVLVSPRNFLSYGDNGSRARSRGVELSLEVRPATGLTLAAWASVGEAKLTEDFPAASSAHGEVGDLLPYVPRVSGHFSLNQGFPVSGTTSGFVGAGLSYVGSRRGTFVALPAMRAQYPAYTKVDLRAGLEHGAWTAHLYANNITDKRGVLGGGAGSFPPFAFFYIQPRTVGVSLSRSW